MKYIAFRVKDNAAADKTLSKLSEGLNNPHLEKNPLSFDSELIITKHYSDLLCFMRYKLFLMFNLPTFVMRRAIKYWFKKNGYVGELIIYNKKELSQLLWDNLKS